jgi:hypothetical protein
MNDRREQHPPLSNGGRRRVDQLMYWALGILWSLVMGLTGLLVGGFTASGEIRELRAQVASHEAIVGHPVMVERVVNDVLEIKSDITEIKQDLRRLRALNE